MAGGKYSKLISLATRYSIGYGAFLGAVEAPKKPQNVRDATEQAQWSTLGKNVIRDIALGLADDIGAVALAAAVSPFIPGAKRFINPLMGFLGAVGGGMIAAVGVHDMSNFIAARQYMAQNAQPGVLADQNLSPISGFLHGGAGAAMRRKMTGISSPSATAVMHQIKYNPIANLYAMLIRPQGEDQGGEVNHYNPVRSGLLASNAVGASFTALSTPNLGFGKATLLGSALGMAAGFGAVAASDDLPGVSRAKGYAAVASSYAPLLGGFTALELLRYHNTPFKKLNAITGAIDVGVGFLGKRLGQFGTSAGKAIETNMPRFIANAVGKMPAGPMAAGIDTFIAKSSIGMMGRTQSGFFSFLNKPFKAAFDATQRDIGTTIGANIAMAPSRIVKGTLNTAKWTGMRIAETFEHTGATSPWAQNLALAHLASVVPHAYHVSHQIMTGGIEEHRKTHKTKIMKSAQDVRIPTKIDTINRVKDIAVGQEQ